MYIIVWKTSEGYISQLSGDHDSVISLTEIFESKGIKFKVGDKNGPMSQTDCLKSDYTCWLDPENSIHLT